MAEKDLRINEGIRVREVRLIDADGNQKGIVPTFEALQMAREVGCRPRGGRTAGPAAGVQNPRLREVQVRAGKEDPRGEEAPEADPDQGDPDAAEDRRATTWTSRRDTSGSSSTRATRSRSRSVSAAASLPIPSSARMSSTRSSRCSEIPSSWRSPPRWKGGRCRYS